MMTTEPTITPSDHYAHHVRVERLPEKGLNIKLALTIDECAQLARFWELAHVSSVEATLQILPRGRGVYVTGEAKAHITYVCGVTLEPFDAELHESIEARFSPDAKQQEEEAPVSRQKALSEQDDVPLERLDGSTLDVGELVVEFLTLGIDLYPRKPDVVFQEVSVGEPLSPFSKLAHLKIPERKK